MSLFGTKQKKNEKFVKYGMELIAACKQEPQEFVKILQLVEACPKATDYSDKEGRTALHWSCARHAKPEVVQYLGNFSKTSLTETSNNGMYPLHFALRDQAPAEVIEYLIAACPQAVSKQANGGWYPLHFACAKINNAKIVITLLKAFPSAMLKPTADDHRIPLHFAAAFQDSIDVVASFVKSAPETVRQKDKQEWCALHFAAAYNNSLPVMQYLIQSYEPSIQLRARLGQMPIHLACLMKRPLQTIQFLTKQCPMGVKQMDENQRIPLQLAVSSGCSIDVLKSLIREWPQSAAKLGNDAFEITRTAMNKLNPSKDEFDDFCRWVEKKLDGPKKPDGIDRSSSHGTAETSSSRRNRGGSRHSKNKKKDKSKKRESNDHSTKQPPNPAPSEPIDVDGLPPEVVQMVGEQLHQACEFPQQLAEIQGLLNGCQAAAKCPNHIGNLPLHTACLNKAKMAVIKYLIDCNREALKIKDENGNLPLHMACFSSSSYTSVEVLVKEYPEAIFAKNNDGESPLGKARSPFYEEPDQEIIEFLETSINLEEERLRKEEEERRRKEEEERIRKEEEEARLKEEARLEEEANLAAAMKLQKTDSFDSYDSYDSYDDDRKLPRSSFYAAALALAQEGNDLDDDSSDGGLDDIREERPPDGTSFFEDANESAVTDSFTAVAMVSDPKSSFYKEALNNPRDSVTELAKALDESLRSDDSDGRDSKPAKPGIQYVSEPAVNVDSVMYQMEYGDYPKPKNSAEY